MARAIEEAGFSDIKLEAWLYSSGFPKSLSIPKKIEDKALSKVWEGWGTALKPSWEPVIVAKKPL
jgi:site-specific DNA-methyltransferase (adenine-specific)